MQNKKINIKKNVMDQIKKDKVSMKPKAYFIFATFLTFTGFVFAIISSVFLLSLAAFLLRAHGPMANLRLSQILTSFPWWAIILGAVGIIIGIFTLKKFEFSYKFNPLVLIMLFIGAIVLASILIDITGLNNLWLQRGPMRGIMRQYIQDNPQYEDYNRTEKRGRFKLKN